MTGKRVLKVLIKRYFTGWKTQANAISRRIWCICRLHNILPVYVPTRQNILSQPGV